MADQHPHVPGPSYGFEPPLETCDTWAEKAAARHGVDMNALRETDPPRFRQLRDQEKHVAFEKLFGLGPGQRRP